MDDGLLEARGERLGTLDGDGRTVRRRGRSLHRDDLMRDGTAVNDYDVAVKPL